MAFTVEVCKPWFPHDERPAGAVVDVLLLHHTADRGGAEHDGDVAGVLSYWRSLERLHSAEAYKDAARVSAHFVIGRSGKVAKCVAVSGRAWHAGSSRGPHGDDVNDYSVGVELCNRGDGEGYPAAQVESLMALVASLREGGVPLRWCTGHHNVCLPLGRKVDPFGMDMREVSALLGLEFWNADDGRPESLGVSA